ncbi:EpsG family protein [Tessaracoccus sp. Y1736]
MIVVVFVGNSSNPDYDAYLRRYTLAKNSASDDRVSVFESGFQLMFEQSSSAGLSYQDFVASVGLIGLLLINRTVRMFPGAGNFVYPLYLLYPLVFDAVQLRNFLALAVVIHASRYLLLGGVRNRLFFFISVIVATTFHQTAIVYALLGLVPMVRMKSNWPIYVGSIALAFLLAFPGLSLNASQFVSMLTGSDRFDAYLETRARTGFLVLVAAQVWSYFLLRRAWTVLHEDHERFDPSEAPSLEYRLSTMALNASKLAFLAMPLYVLSSNFWRFPRNMHILYYLAFFVALSAMRSRGSRYAAFVIAIMGYVSAFFAVQVLFPLQESLAVEFFTNNVVLNAMIVGIWP